MKKILIAVLTLISLSSFGLNEGLSDLDLVKLSADKDVQLQSIKDYFRQERDIADSVQDHDEGKIMATIIILVEKEIRAIEKTLFPTDRLMSQEDLRDIDFKALQKQLEDTRTLIDELNI